MTPCRTTTDHLFLFFSFIITEIMVVLVMYQSVGERGGREELVVEEVDVSLCFSLNQPSVVLHLVI